MNTDPSPSLATAIPSDQPIDHSTVEAAENFTPPTNVAASAPFPPSSDPLPVVEQPNTPAAAPAESISIPEVSPEPANPVEQTAKTASPVDQIEYAMTAGGRVFGIDVKSGIATLVPQVEGAHGFDFPAAPVDIVDFPAAKQATTTPAKPEPTHSDIKTLIGHEIARLRALADSHLPLSLSRLLDNGFDKL